MRPQLEATASVSRLMEFALYSPQIIMLAAFRSMRTSKSSLQQHGLDSSLGFGGRLYIFSIFLFWVNYANELSGPILDGHEVL